MNRAISLLFCGTLLSACSGSGPAASFIDYLKTKINPPPLLIGYNIITLNEETVPRLTFDYAPNGAELNIEHFEQIDSVIQPGRLYIVEATAGGLKPKAIKLAKERAHQIIVYLRSQGVSPEKIYIVEYNPSKKGKQSFIYIN